MIFSLLCTAQEMSLPEFLPFLDSRGAEFVKLYNLPISTDRLAVGELITIYFLSACLFPDDSLIAVEG